VIALDLAIPGSIDRPVPEIEALMYRFGNARRRAYAMAWKGIDRLEAIRQLNRETGLPARYVITACDMIKTLPPHVTFGGLALQRLREQGKISNEEYRRRRNSILACRGQANCKGNLCLRIEGNELRITTGDHEWIRAPIFIPDKYRRHLKDDEAYTVLIKRRANGNGYDVKITVDVKEPETEDPERLMALDINSGHVDFAIVKKQDLKPITLGKVDCHELLSARGGKKQILLHRLTNTIRNIAKHYRAEVVAGKLKTLHSKGRRRSNRKTQGMNQFEMRRIMAYRLPLNGVRYSERSESYTSKVGAKLSKPLGLDVHKASAYAFAIKVIDYPSFTFLRSVHADEGDGIPSMRLNGGSGPTALHQTKSLMHNDLHMQICNEATPKIKVWAEGSIGPFNHTILHVGV
jgi:IS605 OrfB family transposase